MTKYRYSLGGGSLSPVLCNLPKGGGAHDRAKYGGHLPVSGGRLPAYRESHASGHELARHKLGAGAGPYADGRQRYLSRWQRRRRGGAHADCARDSSAFPRSAHGLFKWIAWLILGSCGYQQPQIPMAGNFFHWWGSAPQQPAPVPCNVYLAADGLSTPERGRAA